MTNDILVPDWILQTQDVSITGYPPTVKATPRVAPPPPPPPPPATGLALFQASVGVAQGKLGNAQANAFKSRLDAAPSPMPLAYGGEQLAWITDFALGWKCFMTPAYADQAIALIQSALSGAFIGAPDAMAGLKTDSNYPSRYMGKHVAMGLDWLDGYSGMTAALKTQIIAALVQWNDYLRDNGYQTKYPAGNYGEGTYVSRVFTAIALQNRDSVNGPRIVSEVLAYRTANVLPVLAGGLNGGYWQEGWNYGSLAATNLMLAGLALEQAGLITTATQERAWAGQVIESIIQAQPTPGTVFDGGDWYTYPAVPPGVDSVNHSDKSLYNVAGFATTDPKQKSYANQIIQTYPAPQTGDWIDLCFRDPAATATAWQGAEPLQYYGQGAKLYFGRSDWSAAPVFLSVCFNDFLWCAHLTFPPGQIELWRAGDPLLINVAGYTGSQSFQYESTYGNTIVINDDGTGGQVYPWAMGVWFGTGITAQPPVLTQTYDYFVGDFRAAWSNNDTPGSGGPVTECTRQVVYLRPNFVIVYDRVSTVKDIFVKQQRWHSIGLATKQSDGSWMVTQGGSKLFRRTFSSLPIVENAAMTTTSPTVGEQWISPVSATVSIRFLTVLEATPSSQTAMDAVTFATAAGTDSVTIGGHTYNFASTGAVNYTVS